MDLNTIAAVARPASFGDMPPWRPGDAYLAGGTWLFSEPQTHLARLIDLTSLGWAPHIVTPDGLELAATCTLAELARLAVPAEWIAAPLIRQCCDALVGSFKIWTMATIGGNLCLALPAGPITALAVALDGACRILRPDGTETRVPAANFVTGPGETLLRPGEVLRAVMLPAAALRRRTAFGRASLSPLGRSGALLVGTRDPPGAFALTVTAATRRPVRLDFASVPAPDDLAAALAAAIPENLYFDDVHGRPDWRRQVTFALADDIRADLAPS